MVMSPFPDAIVALPVAVRIVTPWVDCLIVTPSCVRISTASTPVTRGLVALASATAYEGVTTIPPKATTGPDALAVASATTGVIAG